MLRSLLVFAILIPGLFAALRNPFAAVLLYLWFALFRPQEFSWVDISALRLSLILGIILIVRSLLSGIRPNLSHPLSAAAVLFVICALAAQFNVVHAATGWYWVDFMVRLLAVCLLCVTMIDSRERFLTVLAVIAVSFGFHTAKAGLFALTHPGTRFAEGFAGAFADNNGYALGMAMVLWLLVGVAQNVPRVWIRRGLLAAAALTVFGTIGTFSRGGFVALCASTLIYVYLQRKRSLAIAGLLVLVLLLPFVPLPEGYTDRLQTIQTYEETNETSALSRLHFWQVAVDMAVANPLGVGLFNYEFAYDDYDFLNGQFGKRRSVHSSYFQVLAETGFVGTAVYAFMLVYSLSVVRKVRRRARLPGLDASSARFLETSANALGASMAAFMAGGAFIALALNDLTWLSFALLASLDRLSAQMVAVTATTSSGVTQLGANVPLTWRPAPSAAFHRARNS